MYWLNFKIYSFAQIIQPLHCFLVNKHIDRTHTYFFLYSLTQTEVSEPSTHNTDLCYFVNSVDFDFVNMNFINFLRF